MFAYCCNNPVNYVDSNGYLSFTSLDRETHGYLTQPLQDYTGGGGGNKTFGGGGKYTDNIITDYISGEESIFDIPFVKDILAPFADNALAMNKIRSGCSKIKNAWNALLLPDPTPVGDVIAVATATYGVIQIVWGFTDLLIPWEDEK